MSNSRTVLPADNCLSVLNLRLQDVETVPFPWDLRISHQSCQPIEGLQNSALWWQVGNILEKFSRHQTEFLLTSVAKFENTVFKNTNISSLYVSPILVDFMANFQNLMAHWLFNYRVMNSCSDNEKWSQLWIDKHKLNRQHLNSSFHPLATISDIYVTEILSFMLSAQLPNRCTSTLLQQWYKS